MILAWASPFNKWQIMTKADINDFMAGLTLHYRSEILTPYDAPFLFYDNIYYCMNLFVLPWSNLLVVGKYNYLCIVVVLLEFISIGWIFKLFWAKSHMLSKIGSSFLF